jgi:hypothetical protein
MLGTFHSIWGWVSIGADTVAGLYGIGSAIRSHLPGRTFRAAVSAAIVASLVQVTVGVVLYGLGERPGRMHVFYGVLTAVSLAVVYVYRGEMREGRSALRWGLFCLFLAGLGLRAVMTYAG